MAKITDKSIAGNITSQVMIDRLLIFLVLDLFIILFATWSWCIATETAVAGGIYPGLQRSFELGMGAHIWDRIGASTYSFGSNTVYCGGFFSKLLTYVGVFGMLQTLVWSISFISEYFRIKKMLAPLNQMAINTAELAQSDTVYSDIQNKLITMDPLSNIHISTGNRDLLGLEDSINTLLDKMREAYSVQSRFVSDASHELRTPIAVIKGYADMLDRWGKEDSEILAEGIEAIQKESDSMNRLVEQLLFLARADNGRQTVTMSAFSLTELAEEVYTEFDMIDNDHEYTLNNEGEISIEADRSMIKECMRILTDNARKYTEKGKQIFISTFVNEKGEKCFEVRDTGIGIAPDEIPHIFDRFYRSDPARTREGGGTGLGLSIAKQIADYHNAYFNVVSYTGLGTRITFVFREGKQQKHKGAAYADNTETA